MSPTADLRHIDVWLFDLDHTLYPPECPVMGLVDALAAQGFEDALDDPAHVGTVVHHQEADGLQII